MDVNEISSKLKQWATPDEAFRENLLQRCLDELGQSGSAELDDDALDLLAAAGDAYTIFGFDDPSTTSSQ